MRRGLSGVAATRRDNDPMSDAYWLREQDKRVAELEAEVERLREALRTIRGPEDRGPWIEIYREAGGGYSGLQAIARVALGED
jgi:hypothetical protein